MEATLRKWHNDDPVSDKENGTRRAAIRPDIAVD